MLSAVISLSLFEWWFSFLWKSQTYFVSFVLAILELQQHVIYRSYENSVRKAGETKKSKNRFHNTKSRETERKQNEHVKL